MDTRSTIAAVVLDYKSNAVTRACVESVLEEGVQKLIVVDCAAQDFDRPAYLPDTACHLPLADNLGFAGGMNQGIRIARSMGARYAWLLNNDIVLYPGALETMARLIEEGVAGGFGRTVFYGSRVMTHDGDLWFRGGEWNLRWGRFGQISSTAAVPATGPSPQVVDWLTGASLVLDLEGVGSLQFDEKLFLYREEVELQIRARRLLGARCLLEPTPLVSHAVGASTGGTNARLGATMMSRNFLRIAWRHAGPFLPLWFATWLQDAVVRPILKRRWAVLAGSLRGACVTMRDPGRIVSDE